MLQVYDEDFSVDVIFDLLHSDAHGDSASASRLTPTRIPDLPPDSSFASVIGDSSEAPRAEVRTKIQHAEAWAEGLKVGATSQKHTRC